MSPRTRTFNFYSGRKLGQRYVIERLLGGGSEGEVYQIRELATDIHRAAKLYFADSDPAQRLSIRHARKLNTLRLCPIVLQYHHSEIITVRKQQVVVLISELCQGQPLERWIALHPGKRLKAYPALHVLYNLVRGLETVHALGEYHSDVHTENILIQPRGVKFELKLIDFYDWGRPARYKQQQDITQTIRVFYDCLGGRQHYARQPQEIRYICAGLKSSLILKRFPSMSHLRGYLESFTWSTLV